MGINRPSIAVLAALKQNFGGHRRRLRVGNSCATTNDNTGKGFFYQQVTEEFVFGATAPSWPGPLYSRGFWITYNDAPQSVGLLRTSDQPVAETST